VLFRTYLSPQWHGVGMQQTELVVVLVVEDEDLIQTVIRDALTEGGSKTEIVPSGEQAVELLERGNKENYRALITDINLSGQFNGWEVAKRARQINPEIPVIYMTGASADQWPSQA
jgi:CheY-like chemotaxis protein